MKSPSRSLVIPLIIFSLLRTANAAAAGDAEKALRRAAAFFRESVAASGGYLWLYSADLSKREGEGKAAATQAWVQPPGTPSVGEAFLDAYAATNDPYYLDAARETAMALVRGQLMSGGWDYRIEFDPEKRGNFSYKSDGTTGGFNTSTLDDDTTQSAVTFLIRVHQAIGEPDTAIDGAIAYALDSLMAAQYPNGAWPQRFIAPPDPAKYPVVKATYPDSWPREWTARDYKSNYTFNDGGIVDMIDLMLLAYKIYGDARYRESALRGGEFILLAQMPDPQPAWAQQYDAAMHPVWARKFEPPAITGGESQGILRGLIRLYDATGDKRFLEPIPTAIQYFRSSLLPDGRLARFYELQTNRPLYFTKDYKLTYSSDDMPTHYSFIVGSGLDGIQADYDRAVSRGPRPEAPESTPSAAGIDEIIAKLDSRGAWVEPGSLKTFGNDDPTRDIISSATFSRNVRALCSFIRANKGK